MLQRSFFDEPPPHNGTPTSIAAADSITESADTLRARVLAYVVSRGAMGATREEIEVGTGIGGNTVRPRVRELIRDLRLVESGLMRSTCSGRLAVVLVGRLA